MTIAIRNLLPLGLTLLTCLTVVAKSPIDVYSPSKRIRVHVEAGARLEYSVLFDNHVLVDRAVIDMQLSDGRALSKNLSGWRTTIRSYRTTIISPVPEKRRNIPDVYTELVIVLKSPFTISIRVYDDGIAYRISTRFRDSIEVQDESAIFRFAEKAPVYFPQVVKRDNVDSYHTSFEENYQYKPIDSIGGETLCFTPVLIAPATGPKISLTESDIDDYPGMFLRGNGDNTLVGKFAPYPVEERIAEGEFPQAIVERRAGFIARTSGTRDFPWRVLMIAENDKDLPGNDLVYRLGAPSRVKDPSWIRPGKGTDEWIIGVNLFNVPFKSGVNTATYKYYIDFAKRFGFQRIMMDAGWSDNKDLFKINPDINMDEISAYAHANGIGLSMWTLALTLSRQLEPALDQFNKWGVDFIMTDFMDRDDQLMVNFYHRVAEACARHKIMVMYHGAFKPAGFGRTWPNAITRESVLGSEFNIWSDRATPEHNLLLPFIRMTAGPMDYEPGILDNATAKTFRPVGDKVMTLGTRCQQAAMFVVYDSPMQLFSGNPSQGLLEPKFMELIGSIPTTWDTTIIVAGKVGDYIVTARKKGNDWFVAAMTDWSPRELDIDLSFLDGGAYDATVLQDGVNADRYPSDYLLNGSTIESRQHYKIKMAPGGGMVMRLIHR